VKRLAGFGVEDAVSQAGQGAAGLAAQLLMLVLWLRQLVVFCHPLLLLLTSNILPWDFRRMVALPQAAEARLAGA
jgi:hypothetical protein